MGEECSCKHEWESGGVSRIRRLFASVDKGNHSAKGIVLLASPRNNSRETHHADRISITQGSLTAVLKIMYKPKGQEGLVESPVDQRRER